MKKILSVIALLALLCLCNSFSYVDDLSDEDVETLYSVIAQLNDQEDGEDYSLHAETLRNMACLFGSCGSSSSRRRSSRRSTAPPKPNPSEMVYREKGDPRSDFEEMLRNANPDDPLYNFFIPAHLR